MVTDSMIGLMWILCGALMVAALIALLTAKPHSKKASTTGALETSPGGHLAAHRDGALS